MKLFSALMLLLCQQHSCVVVVDADAGPPIACPENYDPVWCEGNKYSNKCYAEAAGFKDLKSQCSTDGDIICPTLDQLDKPVWCQGKVNVKQRKYSNQCFATAVGFAESQCTDKDPKMIDPVFCEGIKYDNLCFAEAAGFMESQCSKGDTICSINDFNPVWCKGSIKKYYNQCFATNEGFADSQCTDKDPTTPIACNKMIDPVFCKGIKYDNLCFAEAAGFMESQCSKGDIFCPADVNPVWCQGIRFSNSCFARAAGFLDESQCTDKCEDDETFRKGRKGKNCTAFLRKNNGELRANAEKRCNKKHKGTKKVYDFCMKTCNEVGLGDCGVSL